MKGVFRKQDNQLAIYSFLAHTGKAGVNKELWGNLSEMAYHFSNWCPVAGNLGLVG